MIIPEKNETIQIPSNKIAYIKASTDERVKYQIFIDSEVYGCTEFSVSGSVFFVGNDTWKAVGAFTVNKTIKSAR